MPVPINRTDWRLDRVVQIGKRIRLGEGDGPGSTVTFYRDSTPTRAVVTPVAIGLVMEWNVIAATGVDNGFLLEISAGNLGGADNIAATAGVYGRMNALTQLDMDGEIVTIRSFIAAASIDPADIPRPPFLGLSLIHI